MIIPHSRREPKKKLAYTFAFQNAKKEVFLEGEGVFGEEDGVLEGWPAFRGGRRGRCVATVTERRRRRRSREKKFQSEMRKKEVLGCFNPQQFQRRHIIPKMWPLMPQTTPSYLKPKIFGGLYEGGKNLEYY